MKFAFAKLNDYWHGKVSNKVLERDKYKCVFCQSNDDLVIDHILPVRKGGKSTLENQRILCRSCHSKHTNEKEYSELTSIGKYLREWRKDNPEYSKNYHREWRKKNPGYYNKYINPNRYQQYKAI